MLAVPLGFFFIIFLSIEITKGEVIEGSRRDKA
jgi:hypothetical protein